MEQYISKSALVAEIERKIRTEQGYSSGDAECGYRDCARDILSFLDTFEVKKVDDGNLEKYFFDWYHEEKNRDYNASILYERYSTISKKLAKHFFELGLQAQKGE